MSKPPVPKGTAPAEEKAGPLALAPKNNLPAPLAGNSEFEEFAGAGMENVKTNDVLVPRVSILQALSPQVQPRKAEYIDGGQIGDICDVGLGEVFKEGILFLPAFYRKDYLEWAPRATGKGLVNIHPDDSILEKTTLDEKRRPILPNGNYIAETAQWFGLNLTADCRPCYIPFGSTQLKKSRKWMTLATSEKLKRKDGSTFIPPLFYRAYILTSAEESNNEGDWFGWKIERGPALPEIVEANYGLDWRVLKLTATKFYEDLSAGIVKADVSGLDGATVEGTADQEGAM